MLDRPLRDSRSRYAVVLVLMIVLVFTLPASARKAPGVVEISEWTIGPSIATFSGATHDDLINLINIWTNVAGGGDGRVRMDDFGVGIPLGLQVNWNIMHPVTFACTYFFTRYSTDANFEFNGWGSYKALQSDLHDLVFTMHYGLNFIRSNRVTPYIGLGANFIMARSGLEINLINPGPNYVLDLDGERMPDQHFEFKSNDTTIGALALAGLTLNLNSRMAINAEVQGTMIQINQYFDYEGSMQYVIPDYSPESYGHMGNDNILPGKRPLDLNGLKLTVGILFGL
jgi:hypothetical protein